MRAANGPEDEAFEGSKHEKDPWKDLGVAHFKTRAFEVSRSQKDQPEAFQ